MDIEKMYEYSGYKEKLMKYVSVVDPSAQVTYHLNNEVLEVMILSPSKDELRVEFENFNTNYESSTESFVMSESFFIVIRYLKTMNAGEIFIKPLLIYLSEILALMLFIPQESYHAMDPKLIDLLTQDYYPEGTVQYDDVIYEAFQEAQVNL